MKKKIIIYFTCFIAVLILSGCSMGNTPTKKVENFLNNYKNKDETVLTQLKDMINMDTLMDDNQREEYKGIMERQYEDLTYEIKDETIDGDNATVTVEIEVYDYYKINKEAEEYYNNNEQEFTAQTAKTEDNEGILEEGVEAAKEGAEDIKEKGEEIIDNGIGAITDSANQDSKYIEYRLNKLKDANDRVTYTIEFTLTKIDNVWQLNDIDDITRQKIHGLYEH